MKKIFWIILVSFFYFNNIFALSSINEDDIIPTSDLIVINDDADKDNLLFSILEYFRDSIL
jgi:hypothetical protein